MLLTAENLRTLEKEALEKMASAPKGTLGRLERFTRACADLYGAMYVIEARERLTTMKTKSESNGQQLIPEVVKSAVAK